MRFVPVKTVAEQEAQELQRARAACYSRTCLAR
jgi:hypothetical protein